MEPYLRLPFALCADLVKGGGGKVRPPTHWREGLLKRLFSFVSMYQPELVEAFGFWREEYLRGQLLAAAGADQRACAIL